MIGLAFISDRGDQYLPKCIASLTANVEPDCLTTIDDREHRLGLTGAVNKAWAWALDRGCDYLFHVEEDFVFNEPVDLSGMQYILDRCPWLAQVVLKRQPCNPEEAAAGGIIECHPDEYTDKAAFGRNLSWVEHSRIFSLNPCLIPAHVLRMGWPKGGGESEFTQTCVEQGLRFAFYGQRTDPPRVTHIGTERASGWHL